MAVILNFLDILSFQGVSFDLQTLLYYYFLLYLR